MTEQEWSRPRLLFKLKKIIPRKEFEEIFSTFGQDEIAEYSSFIGRGSGRTTRLIDENVQHLFRMVGVWVEIKDHEDNTKCNSDLFIKIGKRISREHPSVKFETKEHQGALFIRIQSN